MADVIADERWLPIPGYEGRYEVSDRGRVRSWLGYGGIQPRILKAHPNPLGYLHFGLTRGGSQRSERAHRLVMLAFVGPCPRGMEVRHLDGDKRNNALSNLTYGTTSENQKDCVRHGTNVNAAKVSCPKGHSYDEANTSYDASTGWRHCRTCRREQKAQQRARQRGTRRENVE